eukprot:comp22389_c0_seq22/m.54385 comp22389_c0_seq22/g.54385  ORF comp22389_c0_seq22/g.54385 comp22389_c0_seq22/m.54385 type:complete len:103 (+) comp22389_c0_seq22:53-361(+)
MSAEISIENDGAFDINDLKVFEKNPGYIEFYGPLENEQQVGNFIEKCRKRNTETPITEILKCGSKSLKSIAIYFCEIEDDGIDKQNRVFSEWPPNLNFLDVR